MDHDNQPISKANNAPALFLQRNLKIKQLLFIAFLAGLVYSVYSSNFDGPFIFDDSRIQNNPPIHLTNLSATNLLTAGFESSPKTRPLSYMSFALNYYFHGFSTRGYHLVNITIHWITAFWGPLSNATNNVNK